MIEYQTTNGFEVILADFKKIKSNFIFSNQMVIVKGEALMKIFYVE